MSVKITITPGPNGAVFSSPANIQQSDLVFWFNGDTQTHYPIPGCSGLQVAPGGTTPALQPFPDWTPKLPTQITYGCALHKNETGNMTINPDNPPNGDGSVGTDPQTKTITIQRSGGSVSFGTVDVAQVDSVVWQNNDNVDHWPVPNCTGLKVAPGKTSTGLQPAPGTAAPSLPATIVYGCALHDNESGTINIYDNMAAAAQPVNVPQGTPYTQAAVMTGGKSPYQITQDPNNPTLTLQDTIPAGSSAGVAVILNAATPAGSATITVNVTDALGRTFNQKVQLTIA